VVPAKGRSSAARRGEATARHRAAWRRWPVGVTLQDEGKRGECGEAMADTLCAGGEKEKRARVGGLAGAATRWKGGRRSDRGPECATGGRGAVPATGKTGERTGVWYGRKAGPGRWAGCFEPAQRICIDSIKRYPPILKNFQVKYGSVGNYIRNNFAYGNFLKFRIEFELKIREGSSC
jgi:hypothetical protein